MDASLLPKIDAPVLREIIAVLAEKAYRRGFQHGVVYASRNPDELERCREQAAAFRYLCPFTPDSREQSPLNGPDWRKHREHRTVAERQLETEAMAVFTDAIARKAREERTW